MAEWKPTQFNYDDGRFAAHVTLLNHTWQWSVFDQALRDRDGALPCGRGVEPTAERAFESAERVIAAEQLRLGLTSG